MRTIRIDPTPKAGYLCRFRDSLGTVWLHFACPEDRKTYLPTCPRMDFRRKTATVGGLVLVACLVQACTILRAVVPAQDAVRYLIVAQDIEGDGLLATLRSQPEQPLFPAAACLVHRALSKAGLVDAGNWAICLQIAAAIPLIVSVMPVYALFRRLHGEPAALVGGLLYCLLGGIARLGADGLSDSTHLALFCLALWAAANYFGAYPCGKTRWLAVGGLFTGLALLARGEALVLPVAVLASLVWLTRFAHQPVVTRRVSENEKPTHLADASGYFGALRRPASRPGAQCGLTTSGGFKTLWLKNMTAACAFAFALAIPLAPYVALSGACDASGILARLTGRQGAAEAAPLNAARSTMAVAVNEPLWELPDTGRLAFGKKDTSTSARFRGYLAATSKLFVELARTLHYWIALVALVGLWGGRANLSSPLDRFMQLLCATLVGVAVCVSARAGYLSTRHVLLLVVLGVGWAGSGALAIGDWFAAALSHRQLRLPPAIGTSLAAAILLAACAPDCLASLHASRAGHRQAANWLAEHAVLAQAVLDSRGWTALYTGRKTYRYEAAQAAFSDPALAYVVVEQAEMETASLRGETLRLLMAHAGEPVARFADAGEKHCVVIHRWHPERFQQLGVRSYAR